MNATQFLSIILAAALGGLVGGCRPAYPPVVVNDYSGPIEVSIMFEAGAKPAVGVLPAGSELVQIRKGLRIAEITVKDPSGLFRSYTAADLSRERSQRSVTIEVWFVSDKGLRLGDKEDLREFKQRMRKGR